MISQDYLKLKVSYDKGTGLFIWREGVLYCKKGQEAGWLRPDGYRGICIENTDYLAHRLAFLYVEGMIPDEVDHVDADRSNNKWSNIRPCTRTENSLNKQAYSNSKTGIKGVSWHKQRCKFTVRITVDGQYKYFGLYDDINLAEEVAIEARIKHHGNFVRN